MERTRVHTLARLEPIGRTSRSKLRGERPPRNPPDASDPRCGACQYRARFRGDQCTAAAPCDDLFLYWSAYDCETPALIAATDALLASYPRTVILCAQPIYPGEILPTSLGAPERDERVITAALTRLRPPASRMVISAWKT